MVTNPLNQLAHEVAYLAGCVQGGVLVMALCIVLLTAYLLGSWMGSKS